MDILQYLIALLTTRKQIGIEGLGTLYKKKAPGRYDAETHSFLPPSYVLEFTTEILETSNLVEYIQNKRGISEDAAKYFISQFVTEVQNGVQHGEYQLENLGSFKKANDQLIFSPSQDLNTGFDFFALPSVTAELPQLEAPSISIEAHNEEEVVQEEISDVTAPSLAQTIDEPEIEQVQVPEFEQELAKVTEKPDFISANEESKPEETVLSEEIVEEDLAHNELINVEEQTSSIDNDQATEEEVFEEITEVNTAIPTTEYEPANKEENDTWDFEGENVVSEVDFHVEDSTNETESNEETTPYTPSSRGDEEKDVKITSSVHEWDFDSVRSKTGKQDTDLIGEFDNIDVEEPTEEEKHPMPLYQKLIIGLVVLALVIAVAYFLKPQLFQNFSKNTVDPDQKIAVPIERDNLKTQQDSLDFADSIMQNAEKVGLDVEPAKDTLKVTTAKSEVKPAKTYDIIITSFATEAKAQEYISRMKKKGFDPKISSMEGFRKNISIATYNNIDSAQKYVIKFRKQFRDPEIYIKPIKNN